MPAAAVRITAPTLALTGERDSGSTPSMSRAIASAVVDGRYRVLSGIGHLPPIEAPESWSAALLEFLDRPNQP
jgi:pimeloyl-ACP methyl ester carboxylesterase